MAHADDRMYRALVARDRRFDGLFYVGVSTTGIYCRPVCRARTPGRDRCTFFRRAAEAERAGFRACFRCRPELAPGAAPVDAVPRLVARALGRIDAGCLNDGSVDELAASLGVTGRQLRRAMLAELGVGPVELAQSRRLALAKQLLHDTSLGAAEVAFASGFKSVRRFNAAFRAGLGVAPTALRRTSAGARETGLVLRLDYRPPLAWDALLGFLALRAIPGVESVAGGEYRRTVRHGTGGVLTVRHDEARGAVVARLSLPLAAAAMPIAARVRALFDLDAEPARVAEHLGVDRTLRAVVKRWPGLRVPGAFDPFELMVRAVLGQQTTVRGATTLAGRLVARFGARLPEPEGALTHVFPPAEVIAGTDPGELASLGMPGTRARALHAVAEAWATGALRFDAGTPPEEIMGELVKLPGIGPWTAQVIAMRALRWPDAFPAGDLGVRKAMGGASEAEAERRAEAWRPWRAYATSYLWTTLTEETR